MQQGFDPVFNSHCLSHNLHHGMWDGMLGPWVCGVDGWYVLILIDRLAMKAIELKDWPVLYCPRHTAERGPQSWRWVRMQLADRCAT
jgi:hypothetical protein